MNTWRFVYKHLTGNGCSAHLATAKFQDGRQVKEHFTAFTRNSANFIIIQVRIQHFIIADFFSQFAGIF